MTKSVSSPRRKQTAEERHWGLMARRIGTTRQEVNRLTDLRHATKIDRAKINRIDAALRALGKRLYLDAA